MSSIYKWERRDFLKKERTNWWKISAIVLWILVGVMWAFLLAPKAKATDTMPWEDVHTVKGACLNIKSLGSHIVNIPQEELKSMCAKEGVRL